MDSTYWVGLILFLVLIYGWYLKEKEKRAAVSRHVRKKREEIKIMEELARHFIGKECIIYTITSNDSTIQGIIKTVTHGGILMEDAQGQPQAVNLEYVTRIREYPRNKKGKKKSVVMD